MTAPALNDGISTTSGRLVSQAIAALAEHRAPIVALPLPEMLIRQITSGGKERLRRLATVSWERAADATAWFGIGVALKSGGPRGSDRRGAHAFLDLLGAAARIDDTPLRAWFGFEFDPGNPQHDPEWNEFGGWQAVLPRIILSEENHSWRGSLVVAATNHLDANQLASWIDVTAVRDRERPLSFGRRAVDRFPGPERWQAAVAEAVEEIRAGAFQKVVLARQERLIPAATPAEALSRLAGRYPHCFTFRFDCGPSVFLGASPERLVSLERGLVRADSLAGSRPRGADSNEDQALARELLASDKEREEHALVVDAIRRALAPACSEITAAETPGLMQLATVQHLHTAVTGRAAAGTTILDLAERMHPTPAVGGFPYAAAMDAIRRLEGMDRGWYAAPVGWAEQGGDGEFAVALRTALVGPHGAKLYAGCGIVAGSNPERELAETAWKFQPLREALA